MCSERSGMLSWFHRYFDLSDPIQFGWDMGLYTQALSVPARKVACSGQTMCSDRSSIFSRFYKYFDLSDPNQFCWDMGLSTTENSVHVCQHACMLVCTCRDIIVMTSMSPWFCRYIYISNPTQIGQVIKILIFWQTEGRTNRGPIEDTSIIHIK